MITTKLKLIKLSLKEDFVLPKPLGESEDEFVGRCLSDSTMEKEFPDLEQRYAVCINQYK